MLFSNVLNVVVFCLSAVYSVTKYHWHQICIISAHRKTMWGIPKLGSTWKETNTKNILKIV